MKKLKLFFYLLAILSIVACEEEDNLNKLPSNPELLYPENGSAIDINSITFKWKRSSDPENDDIEYSLLVSSDSINWVSVYNDKVAQVTITDTSVFELGKTYYWKVKAENDLEINEAPQESGESVSDVNYFYTMPPGVKNLKDTSGHEFVTLYWNDPSGLDYVEIDFEPEINDINQPIIVKPGVEKLQITGLENRILYTFYVTAYDKRGINSNTKTVQSLPLDPTQVHDADFNIYNVTQIGNQVWMRENLRTTRWQDGTPIVNSYGEKYYRIGSQSNLYGYYYRPYWAFGQGNEDKNPCPCGYHVPSDEEWIELEKYLEMPDDEIYWICNALYRGKERNVGNILKSTTGWPEDNGTSGNGIDFYQFNLLPAGYLNYENKEYYVGEQSILITSSSGGEQKHKYRKFSYQSTGIGRCKGGNFYSVRCIKD